MQNILIIDRPHITCNSLFYIIYFPRKGIVTQEWVTYALLGFSRAQRERLRDPDGTSLQFIEI
jgi:hypothetical protein